MNRIVIPLLIPLTAIAAVALIVFTISRILLSFSKGVTPPVALGIAMAVLLVSALVASRVSSA